MSLQGAAVGLDHEIRAELTGLADALDGLDPAGWDTPSLCPGWRVRELVAHLTLPAHHGSAYVVGHLLRAQFRWHVASGRMAARDAGRPPAELLTALRSDRLHAWRPPGGGAAGALVHAVVHGLDATVPLAIERELPPARLRAVLDSLVTPASLKHFGVDLAGLALRAEDVDWSYGSGRPVPASGVALVLALSGRSPLPAAD